MKALIDTNILIHRETKSPKIQEIGPLFYWLNKTGYQICIHPVTQLEIFSNKNKSAVEAFSIKMQTYELLRKPPKLHADVENLSIQVDKSSNDRNDTEILNELYCKRVDAFITQDNGIHKKAKRLGIGDSVFTIDGFLDLVKKENPGLAEYDVLEIKKIPFINIDVDDPFFDSFKKDYKFEDWFNAKSSEDAYVLVSDTNSIEAFLYLKIESEVEDYRDIEPVFKPAKRLKIGTLKVTQTGMRLGERFLKIIFDNAKRYKVAEIYVTLFDDTDDKKRLRVMLESWGFIHHGYKNGKEKVYKRIIRKDSNSRVDRKNPKMTYPMISKAANFYMISIQPEFHTDLFPDSILRGENPNEFKDGAPHRNAISKSYVSGAICRDLKSGDGIAFYRTGGHYEGVVSTIGIVEEVVTDFTDVNEFVRLTNKRTVFSQKQLRDFYTSRQNKKPILRAFVINFLYVGTIPKGKKPNLKKLKELDIIDKAPRGIAMISAESFKKLYERL